jgi:hypothetical protein
VKVRQGWSGEVAPSRWAKFDIELEEEDLRRLLVPVFAPQPPPTQVPVDLSFRVLEIEAEILVMTKLVARYGYPREEGKTKVIDLQRLRDRLLQSFKKEATDAAG